MKIVDIDIYFINVMTTHIGCKFINIRFAIPSPSDAIYDSVGLLPDVDVSRRARALLANVPVPRRGVALNDRCDPKADYSADSTVYETLPR